MDSVQNNNSSNTPNLNDVNILKCKKCGKVLDDTCKFCTGCGEKVDENNITSSSRVIVSAMDYDPIFTNSTADKLLESFIKREMAKAGIEEKNNLIPSDILKRKNLLNIIFSVLVFIYISLIFFHFPSYTYIIGMIVLSIFFCLTRKYNLIKYLKKEIKSRPSEKILNIVMNVKNSFVHDNTKILRIVCVIIAIIVPLIVFFNPRIMYEKVDNGYAVRFYTFGVTNFTSATIPQEYKGENVVSLRGNTFSNMPFLENVILPDTVTEIRGQAFKNDKKLMSVNIPSKLEYLGGGAFYNCTSISNIELPDTLTYLGGEAFYNATSLESVKLSEKLTEIRGNTFENCSSLESIIIPDSVTRIGGHAFYANTSLSNVVLTENSSLTEIGSSAFRMCNNLYSITLPRSVRVNSRAFKESPTVIQYFKLGE